MLTNLHFYQNFSVVSYYLFIINQFIKMKKIFIFLAVISFLILSWYFYVEYTYDKNHNNNDFSISYNKWWSKKSGNGLIIVQDAGTSNLPGSATSAWSNPWFMEKAKNVFGGWWNSKLESVSNNYAIEKRALTTDSLAMPKSNQNIGFSVGADQDIELFRENIANGHIPNPDIITYNGVYSDYHFSLPDGQCDTMFCPLLASSTIENMDWKDETWVQIWLGSNIKEEDFQRQPTNFVLVIDRSGSMGSPIDQYHYGSVNDVFLDDYDNCDDGLIYFTPGDKCIRPASKPIYREEYEIWLRKTKMELAMEATAKMIDKLDGEDRIWVVVFDDNAQIVHPLKKVKKINKDTFKEHLLDISDGWGTNMESGMKKALDMFDDNSTDDGYQNRLIFITDAMPNLGDYSPQGLNQYVEDAVKDDIFFSFIWVGIDFQQQFVQKIGQYKWNNYFFVWNGYDFYRRLIDEFDYNFFPMIFDLSFNVNDTDSIDKIYGLDTDLQSSDEFFHINTLFPTPPTADGYRWSIMLLKLKNGLEKDLEFDVSYETYLWKKENVSVKLTSKDIKNNNVIKKWVLLTKYADALKNAIDDDDTEILWQIQDYLEENKEIFEGEDKDMYKKEIKTIEKLQKLIKNGVSVEKDYWNE